MCKALLEHEIFQQSVACCTFATATTLARFINLLLPEADAHAECVPPVPRSSRLFFRRFNRSSPSSCRYATDSNKQNRSFFHNKTDRTNQDITGSSFFRLRFNFAMAQGTMLSPRCFRQHTQFLHSTRCSQPKQQQKQGKENRQRRCKHQNTENPKTFLSHAFPIASFSHPLHKSYCKLFPLRPACCLASSQRSSPQLFPLLHPVQHPVSLPPSAVSPSYFHGFIPSSIRSRSLPAKFPQAISPSSFHLMVGNYLSYLK